MSISPPPVDTGYKSDQRLIYYLLIASLFLHLFASQFLVQRYRSPSIVLSDQVDSHIRVKLSYIGNAANEAKSPQLLQQVETISKRKILKNAVSTAVKTTATEITTELNIDRDTIIDAIEDLNDTHNRAETFSENGAVVFDSALLRRLNQSRRRQGIVESDFEPGMSTSFSGGNWSDFIEMSNTCFKVTRANPLEPGSREMWYRVKCRR